MVEYIPITAQTRKENRIAKNLRKIPKVKEAYTLYGDYDVITKVEVEDLKRLNAIRDEILKKN